jgi:hypothetical protein
MNLIGRTSDTKKEAQVRSINMIQGWIMLKKTMLKRTCLLVMMILTACNSADATIVPALVLSESPQPTGVTKVLPTPLAAGRMVSFADLQVVMRQAEITTSYLNEYGSLRQPSTGVKFLWIHLTLTNSGQTALALPVPEHYSVLNGTTEYKSIYGRRKDYPDYMTLPTSLVEGQSVDAWLRFDIPSELELEDLWFVFLPESTQISVGFSPSESPWGDQPIYLWTCVP